MTDHPPWPPAGFGNPDALADIYNAAYEQQAEIDDGGARRLAKDAHQSACAEIYKLGWYEGRHVTTAKIPPPWPKRSELLEHLHERTRLDLVELCRLVRDLCLEEIELELRRAGMPWSDAMSATIAQALATVDLPPELLLTAARGLLVKAEKAEIDADANHTEERPESRAAETSSRSPTREGYGWSRGVFAEHWLETEPGSTYVRTGDPNETGEKPILAMVQKRGFSWVGVVMPSHEPVTEPMPLRDCITAIEEILAEKRQDERP